VTSPDDLDALRDSLSASTQAFAPELDPARLAESGRRRQRVRQVGSALAGLAAVAAISLALPIVWPGGGPIPARPAPVATPTAGLPSVSYPAPSDGGGEISTEGWLTFQSKEYPITFTYPPDWTITAPGQTDGCGAEGCELSVNPPADSGYPSVWLLRNGFDQAYVSDDFFPDPALLFVVGGAKGWADASQSQPTQVGVGRAETSIKGSDDYFLTLTEDGTSAGASALVVGGANLLKHHPEALFSFGTSIANTGGSSGSTEAQQAIWMILASAKENRSFDPTRPDADGAMAKYANMATPRWGAVQSDGSDWFTLKVAEAGIELRHPENWIVLAVPDDEHWELIGPEGYRLVVQLARDGDEYFATGAAGEKLGELAGVQASASMATDFSDSTGDASAAPEVRWVNGGVDPVSVELTLTSVDGKRQQDLLRFGAHRGVRIGTGVVSENPSPEELDQAIAILTSVRAVS